jgi:SAM-dependent methyltransferase
VNDSDHHDIPAHFFVRADESPDEHFYAEPRLVTHIDQATIDALTEYYRAFIPADARVLDLMSSWVSHLPEEVAYPNIVGLGMNATELQTNRRLDAYCVQNLNDNPTLPYDPGTFDRAMIAVSIQYLTRPVEVLASACEALSENGAICIAMSHRLFPTKAIAAFQQLPPRERIQLVGYYLDRAGFTDVNFEDRSPENADPLWIVTGRKSSAPGE